MSALIANENRKLYCIVRDRLGMVRNTETSQPEPYDKKNFKKYIQKLKNMGGDMFGIPCRDDAIAVVYEQAGKKPAQDDKIVAVFGDIKLI